MIEESSKFSLIKTKFTNMLKVIIFDSNRKILPFFDFQKEHHVLNSFKFFRYSRV